MWKYRTVTRTSVSMIHTEAYEMDETPPPR